MNSQGRKQMYNSNCKSIIENIISTEPLKCSVPSGNLLSELKNAKIMSCFSQITQKNEIFTPFRAVKFTRLKNIKHFKDHKTSANFQTLHRGDVKAEEQHIRRKTVRRSENKGCSASGSSPADPGPLDGSKTPPFPPIQIK